MPSNHNSDVLGVIRSAIVPGPSEKHYDIVFRSNCIEIIYIGEYKSSRLRQFLGKQAELQIYRILKSKRRQSCISDRIIISREDIVSIRLEKPSRRKPNSMYKAKTGNAKDLIVLEIKTRKTKHTFYVSSNIYSIVKKIINKYFKLTQGSL